MTQEKKEMSEDLERIGETQRSLLEAAWNMGFSAGLRYSAREQRRLLVTSSPGGGSDDVTNLPGGVGGIK